MKPGDEILIRAKLISVRESDNEVTVGFDSTTTAVVPLGAVGGRLEAVAALIAKWDKMADDFEVTRGDSQVEGAYSACAFELEAALVAEGQGDAPAFGSPKENEGMSDYVERIHDMHTMRAALQKIRITPAMPFPDPAAHSWRAFGEAVYRAYRHIQILAEEGLSVIPNVKALRAAAPSLHKEGLDVCRGCGNTLAKGFHDCEPERCNYCGHDNR